MAADYIAAFVPMGDPALDEAETVARLQRVVDLWEMSKAVEPDVLVDLAYNMATLGASFVRELASLRGENPMGTLTGHLVERRTCRAPGAKYPAFGAPPSTDTTVGRTVVGHPSQED